VCYNDYSKKSESEEMKMDVREKAIQRWGFENARTIVICVLAEQGKVDLAEQFFDELTADED
jgi:pentatricopeptide repeat protein